jgi:hypothetical protein
MTPSEWPVLREAQDAIRVVVARVPEGGWRAPTPCEQWDVTQVLQHAVADQVAYVSKLTGGPGPSYDPFSPTGELEGAPVELLEEVLRSSADAFGAVDPDDPAVPVPLPPFQLPAATGQPSPLTPSLARSLRPVADALVEPLRGFAFGAATEPEAGAGDVDALLNHLGRRADWKA